jgi:glucokinase
MKIGMDLGGSHLAIALINDRLEIVDKIDENFTKQEKSEIKSIIIDKMKNNIYRILEQNHIKIEEIQRIGISCPGTTKDGVILKAGNLDLRNFDMGQQLKKHFENIDIIIRNDATNAAISEKELGSIKGYQDSMFITLGTGIGGAVFIGGKLIAPKTYPGVEIGHITIQKEGRQCTCGKKGCFETYASMKALKDKIREEYHITEELHSRELMEILANKSEQSEQILEEYLENLKIGIANLIDIFEPEVISIGGSFAYYKEMFLDKLIKKLQEEHATFNERKDIKIVVAEMQNDAGIIGSVIE